MTNRQPIPTDALLVAIDIAKVRNEVLIEAPNHKRRRRLSVLNTRAEHDRLIETLRAYGKPVICAFEATGNYHRPIAWRLIEAGFDVLLVSSMALARTREALHNGWDKNDPRDAQVILQMLRIGATQRYHDPLRAGINDVQELSKTHEAIAKAKTEIQHRILKHYLPLYFPEIERFRGNSRSDWFFARLKVMKRSIITQSETTDMMAMISNATRISINVNPTLLRMRLRGACIMVWLAGLVGWAALAPA